MDLNLAAAPYYDDFDAGKNFYRILFKPGVPVQSRELTQLQSILQDQIKKFANHIFQDGSRALKDDPVSVTINRNVRSVKLQPAAVVVPIESYLGKYVTSISGLIGKVIYVYDNNNPTLGDPQTLIINVVTPNETNEFGSREDLFFYNTLAECNPIGGFVGYNLVGKTADDVTITGTATTNIYSNEITLNTINGSLAVGDYVTGVSGMPTNLYVVKIISPTVVMLNDNFGVSVVTENITFIRKNTSPTLVVGVSSGAYYKNGIFIRVPYQTTVVQKYTSYPTKSVILKYQESVISYNDDSSLLDPAFGSSNYLGPGADRLKIELILDSVDLDANGKPNYTDRYIEIIKFTNGNEDLIESSSDTTYAEMGAILAERTYSESGNYIIDPFKVSPAGSASDGINNKFFISKGRGFIGGYDIATIDRTELLVPKSTDYTTNESVPVNTPSGPYILIDSPTYSLPDEGTISLYDWMECHSTTNKSAISTNTLVGYVLTKHIQFDSVNGSNNVYRYYWDFYDHWSESKGPKDIKSIIGKTNWFSAQENNLGTNVNPTFFANVSSSGFVANATGSNEMKIFDSTNIGRLVFPVGQNYIKDIRRHNATYTKTYKNITIQSGVATVTTSLPNRFVGSTGELSNSIKKQYYMGVIKSPTGIDGSNVRYGTTPFYKISSNIFVPTDSVSMSLANQGISLTINFGNTLINSTMDLSATIYTEDLPRRTKTLVTNATRVSNISIINNDYSVFKSDVYAFKGIYKLGSNSYIGNYSLATTYTANSVVQNNGRMYQTSVGGVGKSLSDANYWQNMSGESLLLYYLNNGQADNYYDHGTVRYIGGSTNLPGNVVILFDYFTHSDGAYFDSKSYPADMYSKIPTYRSPKDSTEFNLRDCLDYRPRRLDDTGYYNSNPFVNLGRSDIYKFTPWYKPVADTTTGTLVDVDYYLSRVDRLYVQNRDASTKNKFYLDKGIPAVNPRSNKDLSDRNSELIATLINAPYTASSSDVVVIHNNSPRYTMKDIAALDNKINNVSKQVKKQGLEIASLSNTVFDRTGANVLFKTGIFIEDFSSLNSADITNPHHTVAMDLKNRICRPAYSANWHNLFFIADPDVNLKDSLVTMNYTEETFVDVSNTSTSANSYIKVNPSGISTDSGTSVNHSPYIVGTAVAAAGILSLETALIINAPLLAAGLVVGAAIIEGTTHFVEQTLGPGSFIDRGLTAIDPRRW
jgi:hypothetical protein